MGYCQGMSDLVAPLLTEIQDESDTFWCFVGLMENTIFISSPRDEDMERQLVGCVCMCVHVANVRFYHRVRMLNYYKNMLSYVCKTSPTRLQMYLRELLRLMLPHFHQHLTRLGEDGLQLLFCHRWILLCFKREFPDTEALRMWEACWAHYQVRAKSIQLLCIHKFVRKLCVCECIELYSVSLQHQIFDNLMGRYRLLALSVIERVCILTLNPIIILLNSFQMSYHLLVLKYFFHS